MAVTKFLARDLVFEVETAVADTFIAVGGIESLQHSPSTNRADSADFDSNGRSEHLVVERGDTWALDGFALEDVANGDKDAGQARMELLAKSMGLTAHGRYRITSPGGNSITFQGSVEVTGGGIGGGAHNDISKWAASVEVSGDIVYA
jgi:hypothetical protein